MPKEFPSEATAISQPAQLAARPTPYAWLKLILGVTSLLVIWLVILPCLGKWEPLQQLIQRNHRNGINADAMFYTEIGPVRGIRLKQAEGVVVREQFLVGSHD